MASFNHFRFYDDALENGGKIGECTKEQRDIFFDRSCSFYLEFDKVRMNLQFGNGTIGSMEMKNV